MVQRTSCPRCGVSLNAANLEAHLAKVHPRDQVVVRRTPSERREMRRLRRVAMSRSARKALALGVVGGSLAIAAGIVLLPVLLVPVGGTIHLEPTSYDFGAIGQTTVSTSFRLHNAGSSNLAIQGVSTSCMCTTARIVYGAQTSPVFGYHGNPAWSMVLPPDAEARLEVFYDPTVHPELGHSVRAVYVLSSDPDHREASVEIHVTEV